MGAKGRLRGSRRNGWGSGCSGIRVVDWVYGEVCAIVAHDGGGVDSVLR